MKNLSLNAKFVFVLSIFVAASVVISVLGISKLNTLNEAVTEIVKVVSPRVSIARGAQGTASEIKNQEKVLVLENDKAVAGKVTARIDDLEKDLRSEVDTLRKLANKQGKQDIDEALKHFSEWKGVNADIRELVAAGKNDEASTLSRTKSKTALENFSDIFDRIIARNAKNMEEMDQETNALYENSRDLIVMVSVFSILSGMILAFVILRAVNKAIDEVINGLNDSSAQVTSASQQIASSSEELSQGATEQASSLEETSSAVEEMNSMVRKNADSARQSTSTSQTSSDSANRGKTVVEEMKRAMIDIDRANGSIMHQTNESNQRISEIVKVISEIGNKTKVINEIVFQTKLLSFNASVEAARAGEHGKGFAVVAEEVGNLAQMSGNAAKEITAMLDSSIARVEGIVQETKSSVEKLIAESKVKVELGTRVAANCGEVLDEIVGNVTQVTQMSQSISTASDEQARGISEITKAVTALDQTTQQTAAAAEETASAAEELSAQAQSMQAIVQTLITTIKGGNSVAGPLSHQAAAPLAKAKPASSAGRVLHLKPRKERNAKTVGGEQVGKRAVGSDYLPSESDPRFKEI